jgi:hypothetical protein
VLTDRERPDPLRRRQGCEKIFDRLPIFADDRDYRPQLGHQGCNSRTLARTT